MRTFSAHVNESGKNVHIYCLETDIQNLRLMNGSFPILSSYSFANYKNWYIFHKTEVQMVILRCWMGLYLKLVQKLWHKAPIFSSLFFQFLKILLLVFFTRFFSFFAVFLHLSQLGFRPVQVQHLKMTVWTSLLWKVCIIRPGNRATLGPLRTYFYYCRGWCIKFVAGLNSINRHISKSIQVIKLSFCQNDPLMGESFWQNNNLFTQVLFELCLLWYLAHSQILGISL